MAAESGQIGRSSIEVAVDGALTAGLEHELRDRYVRRGHTVRRIATDLSAITGRRVSREWVRRRLHGLGIPVRPHGFQGPDDETGG